jgi:predicted phage-related endonuclease
MKSEEEIKLEFEWLQRRKFGIGSSTSPVLVLGKVFTSTPLSVYIDKKTPAVPNTEDNPEFRRGHKYEPVAIELYQEKNPQVKTFMPITQQERYYDYQVFHPTLKHFYADFDGFEIDENGDLWILEVKSPRQMIVDRIKAEGVKDYYQVQCHHLLGVASVARDLLPAPINKCKGKLKGAKIIIYECENIDILTHEVEYDQEMIDLIFDKGTAFWTENVEKNNPPQLQSQVPSAVISNKGGTYEHVKGKAWEEASGMLLLAAEMKKLAEKRHAAAKKQLSEAMKAAKMTKVILPNGTKLNLGIQAGRKSFDKEALKAAHPNIDLDQFNKYGKSFEAFRVYGKTSVPSEETLDGAIGTLSDQLEAFPKRNLDSEIAMEVFEELQNKTELYQRLLQSELERLDTALDIAGIAAIKKATNS